MNTFAAVALSTATLAVLALNPVSASASQGGSSDAWPAAFPLPTTPGTVLSQSSTMAVVRSTDTVEVVTAKLDAMYLTTMGCTQRFGVNRPRDYFCYNPATHKSDEVLFSFASLDPTVTDPSRSNTTAFFSKG